jgi:sugar (pentulose or hexulose) kinase
MPGDELVLAIDNGTQSIKAALFDLRGGLVCLEKEVFRPYFARQPGWAEQDPEVFWQALCRVCQRLWARSEVPRDRVRGLALTTQRGTVINLDADGRPLRPAMLWLDQRRTYGQKPVGGPWGLLFRLAGVRETIAYFQAEAEANWIRRHQPEVWRQTRRYLLLSGYLTYRLTGAFVDSVGCQVAYLPFDYKRLAWASDRDWKWSCLPLERAWLPELVLPGELLGRVSRAAAAATGLPAGLPVVAAAADKACEVLGSGSVDPAVGCLSYGTTATVNVTHPRYLEAIRFLPAYPAAVPGHHTLEVQIFRGYWMVRWFKEEFGHPEVEAAAREGLEAEALFDRLVAEVPPGSMGLMLQPFWSPGLKMPGPEAKGAVIGFGDVHTRAHLYRAILEGLAYALREGKERIEKTTRIPITSLRVSGGGSQSRHALQVTADVFGLPTAKPHLYETSALGAAVVAAVGLGLHPDFPAAVEAMTRIGRMVDPIAENRERYEALYTRVYRRLYPRLRPLYRSIREITGYPA